MGGRRGPPDTKQESYSSASILRFSTVSKGACDFQNRFQDSVLKCSMRPRICRQPAIPPFASVSGVGQKSQEVDGETWSLSGCHLVGFRVSGNPIIIKRQSHVVLAADW